VRTKYVGGCADLSARQEGNLNTEVLQNLYSTVAAAATDVTNRALSSDRDFCTRTKEYLMPVTRI
jgi:hypothetical protein